MQFILYVIIVLAELLAFLLKLLNVRHVLVLELLELLDVLGIELAQRLVAERLLVIDHLVSLGQLCLRCLELCVERVNDLRVLDLGKLSVGGVLFKATI